MIEVKELRSVIIAWLEENPKGDFENFYTHFATLCDVTKIPVFDKNYVSKQYRFTYLHRIFTNRKV